MKRTFWQKFSSSLVTNCEDRHFQQKHLDIKSAPRLVPHFITTNYTLASTKTMAIVSLKFLFTIAFISSQTFVEGGGLRGALKTAIASITPNTLRKLSNDYFLSNELIEHEHDGDPSYDFVVILDKIEPHDRIDSDSFQPFRLVTDLIGRIGGLLTDYEAPESYEIQIDDQYDGADGGENGGNVDADFLQFMAGDKSKGVPINPTEYSDGHDILKLLGA